MAMAMAMAAARRGTSAGRLLPAAKARGQHHFPVISKVTEGVKFADQKRFLSFERKPDDANLTERARSALNRLKELLNEPVDPLTNIVRISLVGVTYALTTIITYHNIDNDNPITWESMFGSGKTAAKDVN